ncbi:hypothetical protein C5167_007531 [Papaver somniferum]|nr:hypothetical protein C5167_007531 [Papaver somniferum]
MMPSLNMRPSLSLLVMASSIRKVKCLRCAVMELLARFIIRRDQISFAGLKLSL